jgi:hypothetical protein
VVGVIEDIIKRECITQTLIQSKKYELDVSMIEARGGKGECVIHIHKNQMKLEYHNINKIKAVVLSNIKFKNGLYYDGGFKMKRDSDAKSNRGYNCIIKHQHNNEFARGVNALGSRHLNILVLDSKELGTTRAIIKQCVGINAVIWVCEFSDIEVIDNVRELSATTPPNIKLRCVGASVGSFIRGFTKRIDAFAADFCGTWHGQNSAVKAFFRNINIYRSKRTLLWLTLSTHDSSKSESSLSGGVAKSKRSAKKLKCEKSIMDFHNTMSKYGLCLDTSHNLTSSACVKGNVLYFEGYSHGGIVSRKCGCVCEKRGNKMIRLTAFIEPGVIDPIADITTPIIAYHGKGNGGGNGGGNGRGGKR